MFRRYSVRIPLFVLCIALLRQVIVNWGAATPIWWFQGFSLIFFIFVLAFSFKPIQAASRDCETIEK